MEPLTVYLMNVDMQTLSGVPKYPIPTWLRSEMPESHCAHENNKTEHKKYFLIEIFNKF